MILLVMTINLLASPVPLSSRLAAPEARPSALQSLVTRAVTPTAQERREVVRAIVDIVNNPNESLHDRVNGIRALGVLSEGTNTLAKFITTSFKSETLRALGIESATALARFAPPAMMAQWLKHSDPEIKSIAARMGGSTAALCALIANSPWPTVRRSAVLGLSASSSPHACILAGLKDPISSVRLTSVEVVGESHGLLNPNQRKVVVQQLQNLVRDRTQTNRVRAESMRTLGKMRQCVAARSALKVYLKSGGLEPLLFASIGALQMCDELRPFIAHLVQSSNDQVVLLGLRAAFENNEKQGCIHLKALKRGFKARRKDQIQDLVNRCEESAPL